MARRYLVENFRPIRCMSMGIAMALVILCSSCSRGTAGQPEEISPTSTATDSAAASGGGQAAASSAEQGASRESLDQTAPGVQESSKSEGDTSSDVSETRAVIEGSQTLQFLFSSNETGSYQIYLANGDVITQITTDEAFDSWAPQLAPDGSRLTFSRSPVADRPPIGSGRDNYSSASAWSIQLDGADEQELIPATAFPQLGPLSWSPDGKSVIFSAVDPNDGEFHLWIADTEEFRPKRLTTQGRFFLDPEFGPDGSEITFVAFPKDYAGEDSERLEVFRMTLASRNEERLTFDTFEDGNPSWSPDGQRIAFNTITDKNYLFRGKWALRAVAVDDGSIETLLADGEIYLSPQWSKDGTMLLFQQLIHGEDDFKLRSLSTTFPDSIEAIGDDTMANQAEIAVISLPLD